jgi:predicted lipoprotein with Yx(FWY)xxD motif
VRFQHARLMGGRALSATRLMAGCVCLVLAIGFITGTAWGSPSAAAKKTTKLELRESKFGKVLFAGNGRALYLFSSDPAGASNCSGECAAAWPPFYARGRLVGGPGINRKLLGRTTRSDGRKQVTYNGHPLYFYVHDPKGQILCHNVFEFGGDWLVVRASGNPAP